MATTLKTTKTNLERIEKIENVIISIADIVVDTLFEKMDTDEDLFDKIPLSMMPGVLSDTLSLWDKISKIKDSEVKRGEINKPVIVGSLSSVSTASLLAIIEAENEIDLLNFMNVNTIDVESFND
jgi:hypothetical protein